MCIRPLKWQDLQARLNCTGEPLFSNEDYSMKPILLETYTKYNPNTNKESKVDYGRYKCPTCDNNQWITKIYTMNRNNLKCCMKCNNKRTSTKHGASKTKLYKVWFSMKQRCYDKNVKAYINYGGRGISYCSEWEHFEPFSKWALKNGYKEGLEIDRINNDGNYEPDNCRWVTRIENSFNKRVVSKANTSGYLGVSWHNSVKKWRGRVSNNKVETTICYHEDKRQCAILRNMYIIENGLKNQLNEIE